MLHSHVNATTACLSWQHPLWFKNCKMLHLPRDIAEEVCPRLHCLLLCVLVCCAARC